MDDNDGENRSTVMDGLRKSNNIPVFFMQRCIWG